MVDTITTMAIALEVRKNDENNRGGDSLIRNKKIAKGALMVIKQ
jgi:hypothetical protein